QRQPDRLQADIGAAAFVGDREAIAAKAKLVSVDQAHADRAGSGDNNRAVLTTMGAETGRKTIADEEHGAERLGNVLQRLLGTPPAKPGDADPRMQPRKVVRAHPGLFGRRLARPHDRTPGLVDAKPRRRRARGALPEQPALRIFDARATAAAAAVDTDIQRAFAGHVAPTRRLRFRVHSTRPVPHRSPIWEQL